MSFKEFDEIPFFKQNPSNYFVVSDLLPKNQSIHSGDGAIEKFSCGLFRKKRSVQIF